VLASRTILATRIIFLIFGCPWDRGSGFPWVEICRHERLLPTLSNISSVTRRRPAAASGLIVAAWGKIERTIWIPTAWVDDYFGLSPSS